jgi:hypothetical protein
LGFPNNKRLSQAIVPVSLKPETTIYKVAIVIMPGLENPAKASAGDKIPLNNNTPNAHNNMVSAGNRLVASNKSEQINISATEIKSINSSLSLRFC